MDFIVATFTQRYFQGTPTKRFKNVRFTKTSKTSGLQKRLVSKCIGIVKLSV